jgi:hypothetical protein
MTAKHLRNCALGTSLMLLTSCVPPLVPYNQGPPLRAVDPALGPGNTVDDPVQKRLREEREQMSQNGSPDGPAAPGTGPGTGTTAPGTGDNGTAHPPKPNYPYALPIPGKDGFVFNPYTNNPVDVRGIPSGTLVRDPQDSNGDHKFRVP